MLVVITSWWLRAGNASSHRSGIKLPQPDWFTVSWGHASVHVTMTSPNDLLGLFEMFRWKYHIWNCHDFPQSCWPVSWDFYLQYFECFTSLNKPLECRWFSNMHWLFQLGHNLTVCSVFECLLRWHKKYREVFTDWVNTSLSALVNEHWKTVFDRTILCTQINTTLQLVLHSAFCFTACSHTLHVFVIHGHISVCVCVCDIKVGSIGIL